jgi:alpha-L-fucosidase
MKRRNFLQKFAYSSLAVGATSMIPEIAYSKNRTLLSSEGIAQRFGDGRDWFFENRYGMFVHWGLYAIPGWHEQHQFRGRVPRSEYVKLKDQWNPTSFDPDKWLDLLEEAGMKYLTFTTKHIDGFCLWDTKQTSFNTMNTPYGRDILKMVSDACHRRNIPLCLYYSNVDNNHPNYPNKGRAHEIPPQPGDSPNVSKYIDYMRAQVTELCTNYGKIHGFWWDAIRLREDVDQDPGLNQLIRKLQPGVVINNRGFDDGDFSTPERDYEKDDHLSFDRPTEACQAVGMESWGYRKNEDYYNDRHLIRSIDKYLSRDANYLLNVGPDPLGVIPEQDRRILKNIGRWYKTVKESFEQVNQASQLTSNKNVMLTQRKNTLYVHLNKDPEGNVVKLRPFTVAPRKATLLNTGEKVEFELEFAPQDHLTQKSYLRLINLPTNEMCNTVLVIKLEFDRPPEEILQGTVAPEVIKDVQK